MAYTRPPLVANIVVAHVVGTATGVIIAAPGAALAIRLVSIQLWITRTTTSIIEIVVTSPTYPNGIVHARGLQVSGVPGKDFNLPEPGFSFAPNEAVSVLANTSVAAGSTVGIAYYYIDPVS